MGIQLPADLSHKRFVYYQGMESLTLRQGEGEGHAA